MRQVIFFLLFLFVASTHTFSQTNKQVRKAKKAWHEADDMIDRAPPRYRQALEKYLLANKYIKDEPELNFYIAVCYLNTINKTKAIPHLEKVLKEEPDLSEEVKFLLARAYHLNLQFDKAIKYYREYGNSLSDREFEKRKKMLRMCADIVYPARRMDKGEDKVKVERMGKIIKRRIKECKTGKEMVKDSLDVEINNIGKAVNSPYPEYAPIISADESVMFFTARRANTTGGKVDPGDGQYFEDIYKSEKKKNGEWGPAQNLGKPICTPRHESAIGLSADGQTLFLYNFTRKRRGEVLVSRLRGNEWTEPEPFPDPINSDADEKSVTISGDEQTIYVVSTREGGFGRRDIYVSHKNEEGEWGEAKNLGPTINTEYNEDGVFIHPNGKTLYFSSQGHEGMGSYDIFKTEKTDTGWTKPKNIGYPINTPDKDVFFVLSGSGKKGYYASVRKEGYGENDLYIVRMPQPKQMAQMESKKVESEEDDLGLPMTTKQPSNPLTILKGVITDAITGDSIQANIKVVDNEKNKTISKLSSNSKTGKYLVTLPSGKNYGISIEKEGYAFHSENFDIPKTKGYQEVVKNVELQPVKAGTKIVLNNIFFDFDKASLRPESKPELDRVVEFLTKFPELKVEISGHTDSKGNATYNKKLSKRRAESVVDFLVKNGIDRSRLEAVGYGEAQPIAPNKKPDGSDNPKGRQMNRRTEMEILNKQGEKVASSRTQPIEEKIEEFGKDEALNKGLIYSIQIAASESPLSNEYFRSFDKVLKRKEGGLIKYMVGKFKHYNAAEKYRQKVVNQGISGAFVVAFKEGKKIDVSKARQFE